MQNFHHLLLSRRNTGLDLHPIQGVNVQSLIPDPILQNEGTIDEADLSLQAEMINTDVDHGQGAIHTPGPKDPHCM